jgi:hypothetical protein
MTYLLSWVRAGGERTLAIGLQFRYNPCIMAKSIQVIPKKRGRPATGKDPLIALRMPPGLIRDLDQWAVDRDLSRSSAIRKLLEQALSAPSKAKR